MEEPSGSYALLQGFTEVGESFPAPILSTGLRQPMVQLLTIEDVAELLQMSPRFVEQQIRLDYLDIIKVGNEVRIEPSAYRQYLENQEAVTPLVGQQRLKAID